MTYARPHHDDFYLRDPLPQNLDEWRTLVDQYDPDGVSHVSRITHMLLDEVEGRRHWDHTEISWAMTGNEQARAAERAEWCPICRADIENLGEADSITRR
jgi:hypothetical protein